MATTVKTYNWDTGLEGWVAAGIDGVAEHDASNGETGAGSLHAYSTGRRATLLATFRLELVTWEDLGVPADATVTNIQAEVRTYYGLTHNTVVDTYGDVSTYMYDFGSSSLIHVGSWTVRRSSSTSADTGWHHQIGILEDINTSHQPSDSLFDIEIVVNGAAGNDKDAAVGVHVDNLVLTITYTPASWDFTGTASASHTSSATAGGYHSALGVSSASHSSSANASGVAGFSGAATQVSNASATAVSGVQGYEGTATLAAATSSTAASGQAYRLGQPSVTVVSRTMLTTKAEYVQPPTPATYRSAASSTVDTPQTSLTIDKPAGTVEGDLLYAFVHVVEDTNLSGPAGWTLSPTSRTLGSGIFRFYYKVAGESEPTSYTWTHANSRSTGHILCIQDGAGEESIDTFGSISANPNSPSDSFPLGSYVVATAFAMNEAATVSNVPAGYAQRGYDATS